MEPSLVSETRIDFAPSGVGSMHDLIGRRIGPDGLFELQSKELSLEDADVWAAWMHDPRQPRRVAVKILHPHPGDRARREQEAAVHHELRDVRGVIPLVDHGVFMHPVMQIPLQYVATDWIANPRTLAAACRPLSWADRLELFCDLLAVVDVAHKRGVSHQSLGTSSIVVDEDDVPWIVDFGQSVLSRERPDETREAIGRDVGMLGVLLHETLAGAKPAGQRVPRRIGGRTLPPGVHQCLSRSLSADLSQRPADAGEMLWDLRPLARRAVRREWVLAGSLLAAVIALAWLVAQPAMYSAAVFSNWSWLMSRLIDPPATLDRVAMIAFDTQVVHAQDGGETRYIATSEQAISAREGLPPDTTSRLILARLITRLSELGARVVTLDYFFVGETTPEANAPLIDAVRKFELSNGGSSLFFGCDDWSVAEGQSTLLDPGLEALRGREHAERMAVSYESDRVDFEIGYRAKAGGSRIGLCLISAAATFAPGAQIRGEVLPAGEQSSHIELSFTRRGTDLPAREPLKLARSIDRVEDLARGLKWKPEQYASLDLDDQLVLMMVPRMPSVETLDAATIAAEDIFDRSKDDLHRRHIEGKVVLVGDRLHSEVEMPDDGLRKVIGASRLIQGYELEAAGIEVCARALKDSGAILTHARRLDVFLLMPLAALLGVCGAYLLAGRVPHRAFTGAVLASSLALVLSCGTAVVLYTLLMIEWNPFLVPCTFATAIVAGVLVPWLRI